MTFLELCRFVVVRAGITGADNGKPVSVINQTGRMALIVSMVEEAHRHVVTEYNDWSFRSVERDFKVNVNDDRISLDADIDRINENAVYGRNNDERRQIHPMPWVEFRERVNTVLTEADQYIPNYFSISPSGDMHFYTIPTVPFVVRIEAIIQPNTLVNDADTPLVPLAYRQVIAYKALMMYHEYDEADGPYQTAERSYMEWRDRLEHACLPFNSFARTQSPEVPITVVPQ